VAFLESSLAGAPSRALDTFERDWRCACLEETGLEGTGDALLENAWLTVLPRSVNLVIALSMIPISKKLDFNDPSVLTIVRGMYIVSNIAIAIAYLLIQARINKKKGKKSRRAHHAPLEAPPEDHR
jgi:hypothetical protein